MTEEQQIYTAEIAVMATVYIEASSESQARKLLEEAAVGGAVIDVATGSCEAMPITDMELDDPRLPSVSLSPAMTIQDIPPATEIALWE